MQVLHLYRQLQNQLSQWGKPQDKRHLQAFAENLATIGWEPALASENLI